MFFFFNDTATTEIYTFPTRRSSDLSVPVILLESSDSRNRAARATSSDVPIRFNSDLARLTKRSEEHTSELQSHSDLVCRLLLEKHRLFVVASILQNLVTRLHCTTHP